MDDPPRDPAEIVLSLGSKSVPASQFQVAITEFVKLAKEAVTTETGAPLVWHVAVQSGSQIIRMIPQGGDTPEAIVSAAYSFGDDLEALQQPQTTMAPRRFTPAIFDSIKKLSKLSGRGAGAVNVTVAGREVPFTPELHRRVEVLARSGYATHGSVEGKLEIINVHSGYTCFIYRDRDGARIKVQFDESLFEPIKAALGKRAVVRGLIEYDPYDRIRRVKAKDVKPLRHASEIPDIDDLIRQLKPL